MRTHCVSECVYVRVCECVRACVCLCVCVRERGERERERERERALSIEDIHFHLTYVVEGLYGKEVDLQYIGNWKNSFLLFVHQCCPTFYSSGNNY